MPHAKEVLPAWHLSAESQQPLQVAAHGLADEHAASERKTTPSHPFFIPSPRILLLVPSGCAVASAGWPRRPGGSAPSARGFLPWSARCGERSSSSGAKRSSLGTAPGARRESRWQRG